MQFVRYKTVCPVFLLLLVSFGLFAKPFNIDTSIMIDSIEGNGIALHDISLSFNTLSANKSAYLVKIGSTDLPENKGHIKNIVLQCNDGVISKQEIACNDGELSFEDPIASADRTEVQFYRNKNGDLSFVLGEFNLAGGVATLHANVDSGEWQANLISKNISFIKLRERLPTFPDLLSSGLVQSDVRITGRGSSLQSIQGEALVKQLSFANEDSTIVGENVATKISFSSIRNHLEWKSKINTTTFQGELYIDPVFIDANANPKDVFGEVKWQVGSSKIEFSPLNFEDSNAIHLEVATIFDYQENKITAPVQTTIQYALFPKVYDDYMQPFLLDTNMADLITSGSLSGSMLIEGDRVAETDLKLEYLSLEDHQNRFSISKLNGNLGWGKLYSNKDYQFGFEAAELYKLRLGASLFSFSNNEEALVLKQAVSVPILDGAVNVENFRVHEPGQEGQSISMDISLTPISMSKLSLAFGWPEMNGNLAGYAPNVTYKKGDVDVQGALLIRGFGGSTTIHNLSASDLFSITPKLSADIQLKNLDLRSLTETFSFGEITGRLEGAIEGLQFVSWSPVEFNAWFRTPKTISLGIGLAKPLLII